MAKCLRGGIEYKRHQYVTRYGETKCEACGQVKMSACEQEFLKAVDAFSPEVVAQQIEHNQLIAATLDMIERAAQNE